MAFGCKCNPGGSLSPRTHAKLCMEVGITEFLDAKPMCRPDEREFMAFQRALGRSDGKRNQHIPLLCLYPYLRSWFLCELGGREHWKPSHLGWGLCLLRNPIMVNGENDGKAYIGMEQKWLFFYSFAVAVPILYVKGKCDTPPTRFPPDSQSKRQARKGTSPCHTFNDRAQCMFTQK